MSVLDLMIEHCISLGNYPLPGIEGTSPIKVDLRPLSYDPEKRLEVLEACFREAPYFDVVLGIRNSGAIWGLPLAHHATQQSGLSKYFVEIVPEHLKDHLQHPDEETPLNRERIYLLFDNFVTTGFSITKCQEYCRSKRLPEDCVIPFTIFNYGIVEVNALVTLDQLLKRARQTSRLHEGDINQVMHWKAGLTTKE